jgi:hypothetical protein
LRIGCLSDAGGDGAPLESKADRRRGDASCAIDVVEAALLGISSYCVFRKINLGIEVRGGFRVCSSRPRVSIGVFRMIVILPKWLLPIVLWVDRVKAGLMTEAILLMGRVFDAVGGRSYCLQYLPIQQLVSIRFESPILEM